MGEAADDAGSGRCPLPVLLEVGSGRDVCDQEGPSPVQDG